MPSIPDVRPQPSHPPSTKSRPVWSSSLPAAGAGRETASGRGSEGGLERPRVTKGLREMEVGRASLGAGCEEPEPGRGAVEEGSVEAGREDGGLKDAELQDRAGGSRAWEADDEVQVW